MLLHKTLHLLDVNDLCAARNDVSNSNEKVVWTSGELICEGKTATPFRTAREFE